MQNVILLVQYKYMPNDGEQCLERHENVKNYDKPKTNR